MSVTLPGTGKEVATELIGGAHYQGVKLVQGDVGSATPITKTAPLPVAAAPASSSAVTSVASNASAVTLLASNANRRGATIFNDADKPVYVKLGSAALATSFTVKLVAGAYYEVPFSYSGIITGIWESGPTGSARVTEIT